MKHLFYILATPIVALMLLLGEEFRQQILSTRMIPSVFEKLESSEGWVL